MEGLTWLIGSDLVRVVVVWVTNALMAALVGGWCYALYRTVYRAVGRQPKEAQRRKLERIPEVKVIAVRTSWLERHLIWICAMAAAAVLGMALGTLRVLGPVGLFAPAVICLVSIALIWLHCHLGRLQLTSKRLIQYGGLFADPPTAIRLKELTEVNIGPDTWWERWFGLSTIRVAGGDPPQLLTLRTVADATRFEAIVLMLKKRDELGLPLHAPLPPDAARDGLKDWTP